MATYAGRYWSLDVDYNRIDITSERETPNEQWRATDSNRHEHHYDRGYPTLDLVVDREHWCDGREGLYNHDPHMTIDESHYECRLCHEVVNPATDPPYTLKSIAGLPDARLSGVRPDGAQIRMVLTDDELAAIQGAGGLVEDVVASILAEAPRDHIIDFTITL